MIFTCCKICEAFRGKRKDEAYGPCVLTPKVFTGKTKKDLEDPDCWTYPVMKGENGCFRGIRVPFAAKILQDG